MWKFVDIQTIDVNCTDIDWKRTSRIPGAVDGQFSCFVELEKMAKDFTRYAIKK